MGSTYSIPGIRPLTLTGNRSSVVQAVGHRSGPSQERQQSELCAQDVSRGAQYHLRGWIDGRYLVSTTLLLSSGPLCSIVLAGRFTQESLIRIVPSAMVAPAMTMRTAMTKATTIPTPMHRSRPPPPRGPCNLHPNPHPLPPTRHSRQLQSLMADRRCPHHRPQHHYRHQVR